MNLRTFLSAGLLSTIACATGVAPPGAPAAVARVELVSMSPPAGAVLTTETVLLAEVRYAIENFKPGVDYYVAPLFASTKGEGTTFSMIDRISDSPKIATPQGTVTIRYPIARELANAQLVRPVKIWFYVMERTGAGETRVIGKTEQLEFTTTGG